MSLYFKLSCKLKYNFWYRKLYILAYFNLVIVEDENGIERAFATNEDLDENEVELAERLFNLYGKR